MEVLEAVDLAASTGMRRGDLVKLPWDAIYPDAIIWRTGKSKGRAVITVPLIPETREVLARIKARYAAEMDARPPEKRKPVPKTILANSHWVPWTPTGFGSRFHDAKVASGLDRNFHDLRGTYIIRLILAGLTDEEVAKIVGWTTDEIAVIRVSIAVTAVSLLHWRSVSPRTRGRLRDACCCALALASDRDRHQPERRSF